MAKRVYELAKELNITSQDLLKKLRSLGVPAESLMELVEDASEQRIRTELSGTDKTLAAMQETRVKPTVIRRRRKNDAEEEAADLQNAPETADDAAEMADMPEAVAEAEPKGVALGVETPPVKAKTKTKAAKTQAAKIISRPEPPQAQPQPAANAVEPETEAEMDQPASDAVTAEEMPVAAESAPRTKTKAAAEAKEAKAKTASEDIKPAAAKRKGKDMPARVISLPKKQTEPKAAPKAMEPAAATAKGAGAPPVRAKKRFETPVIPAENASEAVVLKEDPGRRNKKKSHEIATDDDKLRAKKVGIRKRSVEGDALYDDDRRGGKGYKGKGKKKQPPVEQKTQITMAKAIKRRIKVDDAIVLGELAKRMGVKATDIIRTLMGMGVMATVNQTIDFDTAVLVATEFNYEVERAAFEEETLIKHEATADDPAKLKERPPVVTIMGHVDHGKTSLLDTIRRTKVTAGEFGGITQHIGAYYVTTKRGIITFLDTPGHEAFTAMRARGAGITDIVILVVAADDGVMPQTIEAVNHARAAGVPIIVAINKIDKPTADVARVTRELSDHGVTPEDWGGENIFCEVSAKQGIGIDNLLEMILLQAEVLELRANPDKPALGHVVEAQLDSGRGAVATVLVREGTLRTGDPVVCGIHSGKVRAMYDDQGQLVTEAGPSIPVEIIGLAGVPEAGDELDVAESEKAARQISLHRQQKQRSKELAQSTRLSLDKLYEHMQQQKLKHLNLIIKADVQGSAEAITESMLKLSNDEVEVKVIHAAPGTISESDVTLAAVSNAIIIGFNVRPSQKVQQMANEEGIDMRFYNIIYDAIKDVKNAMVGLMESTFVEKILGHADVRQVFHVPKIGAVAGAYVTDGKMERGRMMRLLRDGVIVYEGRNSSLRRFKDDVKEVATGYECGIGIEHFNDIKEGDVIECYLVEEIRPEITE